MNVLLNNSSSLNPLPLPDIMEVNSLRGKSFWNVKSPIKIAIVMVMQYFYPVLEHGLPPSLKLNHNAYSIFHAFTWSVKAWHAAQWYISTLPELSEWTLRCLWFRWKKSINDFSETYFQWNIFHERMYRDQMCYERLICHEGYWFYFRT